MNDFVVTVFNFNFVKNFILMFLVDVIRNL